MEQILTTFYDEGLFGLSEEEAISRIASMCSWSQKGIKRIIKANRYQVASNYKISLAESKVTEGLNYGFLLLVHPLLWEEPKRVKVPCIQLSLRKDGNQLE